MSRVEEIEHAIAGLSPQDFDALAQWVLERQQSRWDEQLDHDYASGKLDFLRSEANPASGQPLKDWP